MPKGIYPHKPQQGFQKGHKCFKGAEKGWHKKGFHPPTEFKKGHISYWKGKKHPEIAGSKNPNFKGGQFKNIQGYVYILNPKHPNADYRGYVKRANLVMEKHLGRYLAKKEVVHHDGIKDDDRIEKLILFINHSKHMKYHRNSHSY